MNRKASKKPIGKKKISRNKDLKAVQRGTIFNLHNLVALIVSFLFLLILHHSIAGYGWVWDKVIVQNLKVIWDNPDITQEQKWEIKCGFDYRYANYLKDNTPDDAVILLPPTDALFPEGEKSDFNTNGSWGIKNKAWTTYFVYPRKVVYETEKGTNPYYDMIN